MVDECAGEAQSNPKGWLQYCVSKEVEQRSMLATEWSKIPESVRVECEKKTLEMTENRGSYNTLAICIQIKSNPN